MNVETIKHRARRIRAELGKRRVDSLVLTKPVNVTYLTGFSGQDSWAMVTQGSVYLLTDSRYTEQAQKECQRTTIVERKDPLPQSAGKLLRRLKSVRSAGIESSTPIAAYRGLRKSLNGRLKIADGVVEAFRQTKDRSEIRTIAAAAVMAARALEKVRRSLRAGITESELAGLLDLEIRRQGATTSFETIVAFGANASRPHHQPTQRRLRQRDTILIDFGARHKGYCCDITRCFALGKPRAAYRKACDVVEQAQAAAIGAAKAGAELTAVDAAARNVIRQSGLPVYGHGTGHGLGLEIHEDPFLKEQAKGRLQAGQVITIEPGIYIPGKLGVRIEDDILITEDGGRILTDPCPHTPLPA